MAVNEMAPYPLCSALPSNELPSNALCKENSAIKDAAWDCKEKNKLF